jgi:hypothetical protein
MAKANKQNTPSEQRKRRLAQGLRRNHTIVIEVIDPRFKSLVKRTVKKSSSIEYKQYDKFMGRLMKGENDDFEPEKEEEPTSEESDDTFPGLSFVPPTDKQSQALKCDHRNAAIWQCRAAKAMEAAEMAVLQATTGSASTEEADEYFSIPQDTLSSPRRTSRSSNKRIFRDSTMTSVGPGQPSM